MTDGAPDLRQLVAGTALEDLPTLAGRLREAEVLLAMRLAQPSAPNVAPIKPTVVDTFDLKPEQAADIAGVSVGQIYSWSKNQRWASRPSRRCVRINEAGFRRWLTAKAL